MTKQEIMRLRELSDKAIEGPWRVEPGKKTEELYIIDNRTPSSGGRIARMWNGRKARDYTAAFICEFNPTKIKTMLDYIEFLEIKLTETNQ